MLDVGERKVAARKIQLQLAVPGSPELTSRLRNLGENIMRALPSATPDLVPNMDTAIDELVVLVPKVRDLAPTLDIVRRQIRLANLDTEVRLVKGRVP